jgi:hypothetical protein
VPRQFRVRSGRIGAGTELIIHENVKGLGKGFASLHIRLRGANHLFRREQREVRIHRRDRGARE